LGTVTAGPPHRCLPVAKVRPASTAGGCRIGPGGGGARRRAGPRAMGFRARPAIRSGRAERGGHRRADRLFHGRPFPGIDTGEGEGAIHHRARAARPRRAGHPSVSRRRRFDSRRLHHSIY